VPQSAAPATAASSGTDSASRREVYLRAMVFRALGSSSGTVEPGKLGRAWASFRSL
jgi:hypothetical protein